MGESHFKNKFINNSRFIYESCAKNIQIKMTGTVVQPSVAESGTTDGGEGLKKYYTSKNEELQLTVAEKNQNLRRLQAQRNELNAKVRMLREELQLLQEQGSYVGEVVKAMDKKKVLVKVHPEGKFVVDIDKNIDMADVTPNIRVALRNDSYTLHKILPNKVSSGITYDG